MKRNSNRKKYPKKRAVCMVKVRWATLFELAVELLLKPAVNLTLQRYKSELFKTNKSGTAD